MTEKKKKVTLLEEAIRQFNTTSAELEKSYRLLEGQVRQLKEELEVKNQALKESVIEQERLREQAERNDRLAAVGEMAARMAHELRNPLGSIELFVSLLKKGLVNDPEKTKWIEYIKTGVDAMDYALSNLLFFTGKPKVDFKKIDLKIVIEEASRFATHLLQQKEIDCTYSVDPRIQFITADEDLLRQAFLNLILNAVDALPKKGTLTIEATDADMNGKEGIDGTGGAVVKFSDNGCGIPKEGLSKIFDPFYTTKNKGSGLGLAIVHNIIAAHHGVIEVEGRVEGGTCFIVHLPKGQS
jgi:signal transduction histidine kinase